MPETNKKGFPFLGNLGAPEGAPLPALSPTVHRTVGSGRDENRPDELFESLPGQTDRLPDDSNKKRLPISGKPWCAGRDSNPRPSDS